MNNATMTTLHSRNVTINVLHVHFVVLRWIKKNLSGRGWLRRRVLYLPLLKPLMSILQSQARLNSQKLMVLSKMLTLQALG